MEKKSNISINIKYLRNEEALTEKDELWNGLTTFNIPIQQIWLTFAHYQGIGYFQEAEDRYQELEPYSPVNCRIWGLKNPNVPHHD